MLPSSFTTFAHNGETHATTAEAEAHNNQPANDPLSNAASTALTALVIMTVVLLASVLIFYGRKTDNPKQRKK
ncbi:hypothetical protein EKI60_01520 [Candidatus Saccharibacteria bacterium]|nr:MAG: hypothetical protein EKI60_01520 [Candidatus Saccharibacteria bacterium]